MGLPPTSAITIFHCCTSVDIVGRFPRSSKYRIVQEAQPTVAPPKEGWINHV
jgi:hypothetical protein